MKIDKNGFLALLRRGEWIDSYCPFRDSNRRCGSWCPHFGNAETVIRECGDKTIRLGICQEMELICDFNDYVDERDPR